MMCPAIEHPASPEIRDVICFLYAKNMSAAEILRGLCAVYCQNIMSEETLRHFRRMYKDGEQMFAMKSEVVGPRAGLDGVENRKFLTLPGFELRPLVHSSP
jgi:hypothetical protein